MASFAVVAATCTCADSNKSLARCTQENVRPCAQAFHIRPKLENRIELRAGFAAESISGVRAEYRLVCLADPAGRQGSRDIVTHGPLAAGNPGGCQPMVRKRPSKAFCAWKAPA